MTVIETKEKKITVMSAKPSSLPKLPVEEVVPQTSKVKPAGPTYSDAFAQFLQGSSKSVESSSPPKLVSIPQRPLVVVTLKPGVPNKVVVGPSEPSSVPPPLTSAPNVHSKSGVSQEIKSSDRITPVQKKQEAWTNKVLDQTQSQQPQRVKTEKIQPYVSGQNQLYTSQVRAENQQLFYTIQTSPTVPTSPPQSRMKISGKGFDQKLC